MTIPDPIITPPSTAESSPRQGGARRKRPPRRTPRSLAVSLAVALAQQSRR